MSTDLQQLFAETGNDAPATSIDTDAVVRQGLRLRARRRTAVGGALLGVGAAVAASVVLVSGAGAPAAVSRTTPAGGGAPSASPSGAASSPGASEEPSASSAPTSVVIQLDPGELSAAQRARLMAVSLPDPAPGFPVRRWDDPDRIAPEALAGTDAFWTRVWGLAVTPYRQVTTSSGQVSEVPTGPEVTLTVGYFPLPEHGKGTGIYPHERFVEDVDVAGGRGWVTSTSEKGSAVRNLYVGVGDLSVWIGGIDGVSTAQLVALGNALRGLS